MLVLLLVLPLAAVPVAAATETDDEREAAARIIGAALVESRAWDRLAWLTDRIGHRLSGSAALDRAIAWATAEFERDGLDRVWTDPVRVPHWERGTERARVVSPAAHDLAILALGGSVPTPTGGLRAEVVEVAGFDELSALGEEGVRGKIVLFNRQMEPGLETENGYGSVAPLRTRGAVEAARFGAVATLVRSLGTADFRLPHTGAMRYVDDVKKIPSAAVSAEDAMLLSRLIASGEPVVVELDLGCKTLPDVDSANVLAEIRGRERPEEIVVIGAHLDSWDVGTGAHDDGAGCVIVMESIRLLRALGLTPRRTIRAVLFTNEEHGLRGGTDSAERYKDSMPNHVAAVESDLGGATPIGFGISAGEGAEAMLREMARPLASIGAERVFTGGGGADISPMKPHGVPQIGQLPDPTRYFDYHHTAADTLDKIDRRDLDRNVAAMAVIAWMLAESDSTLPRLETVKNEKTE